jgi:putative acetyltransferase
MRYARLAADCRIRPIRRADDNAVAAIIRGVMTEFGAVGQGYSINDPEVDAMSRHYPPPQSRFWVIEHQGRLVGCGGIGPLADGPAGTCELRKMYFLPEVRGFGLGTRLQNQCLTAARAAGYDACNLETLASKSGARHLYRKHGFTDLDGPMGATGHSGCNAWMVKSIRVTDPVERAPASKLGTNAPNCVQ